MPRIKPRPDPEKIAAAELETAAQAAAVLVDIADRHHFEQVTIHTAIGVHRIAITKVSSKPQELDRPARRATRRTPWPSSDPTRPG